MQATEKLGRHAIIIGGSVIGLMAARLLSPRFDKVTLIERDPFPEAPGPRKMTPQSNHYHILLRGGLLMLNELYPGFTGRMLELGSTPVRLGIDVLYHTPWGTGYSQSGRMQAPRDLDQLILAQSRNLLEFGIRTFTLESANIIAMPGCTATSLHHESGRVTGVVVQTPAGTQRLDADLVVDAGGRGSRTPKWLADLGYSAPLETQIGCDLAYTTSKFRIPAGIADSHQIHAFYSAIPDTRGAAMMHHIENDTWHISLQGRAPDYPAQDAEGFMEFARKLYNPDLYEMLKQAERVDELYHMRFPSAVLRHYEKLERFPEGYLVIGDAICSVNPVHGQGMSAHATTLRALNELLDARAAAGGSLDGLAQQFFPRAAELISNPWTLAAMSDFIMYSGTQGDKPADLEQVYQYMQGLDMLSVEDADVHALLADVYNLVQPISALFGNDLPAKVQARLQTLADA